MRTESSLKVLVERVGSGLPLASLKVTNALLVPAKKQAKTKHLLHWSVGTRVAKEAGALLPSTVALPTLAHLVGPPL